MKSSEGAELSAAGIFDAYGYLRLLDVDDPSNIVELDPSIAGCGSQRGRWSSDWLVVRLA